MGWRGGECGGWAWDGGVVIVVVGHGMEGW